MATEDAPESSKTAVSGGLARLRGGSPQTLELPAATGLEDESRASEGQQSDQDTGGMSQGSTVHYQSHHRIPAPSERADAARAATTSVKRARFAFNAHLQVIGVRDAGPAAGRSHSGGSPARSLALRPRLSTGLPWSVPAKAAFIAAWPGR
jgi:hypothetical protein